MEETQRMDAEQRRDCLQRISDISRVMASSIDIDTDDEQLSVAYAEYTELLRKVSCKFMLTHQGAHASVNAEIGARVL